MDSYDLIYAVRHGDVEEMEELIATHGLPDTEELGGGYVLLQKAETFDMVNLLINCGARVNGKSYDTVTPLHRVLRGFDDWDESESREYIEMLLSRGANVNAKDDDGLTPLHYAVRHENDYALLLLEHSADINAFDKNGETCLHDAVKYNNKQCVELLLSNGVDVNQKNCRGITLRKDEDVYPRRTDRITLLESMKNSSGLTPLHYAAMASLSDDDAIDNNREIIRLLIAHSADVNARNEEGQTPLYAAILAENKEYVKVLLEDDAASFDIEDDRGSSVWHYIAEYGCVDLAQLLVSHSNNVNAANKNSDTPLHVAASHRKNIFNRRKYRLKADNPEYIRSRNTLEIIDFLVSSCLANVNAVNNKGKTPLHVAVEMGGEECVKLLLSKNADVDARDDTGSTPLHYATDVEIARLLILHKANVEATNVYLETPLHTATPRHELVELLLANGSDVNARDQHNSSPLHHAAFWGYVKSMELILLRSADVNAINDKGDTPLHIAASEGNIEGVKVLLRAGALVDAANDVGERPLHFAVRRERINMVINGEFSRPIFRSFKDVNDNSKVVELLLENGADIVTRDSKGQTALHIAIADSIAVADGNNTVARLLLSRSCIVNLETGTFLTLLQLAFQNGDEDIVQCLLEKTASNLSTISNPLHMAVKAGLVKTVKYLLDQGANVDDLDEDGNSVLYVAAAMCVEDYRLNGKRASIVKYILDRSPDVNGKSNCKTLEDVVLKSYRNNETVNIIKMLFGYGFSIKPSVVLLQCAIMRQYNEVVQKIIQLSSNVPTLVNSFLKRGFTSLHVAAISKNEKAVQLLLSSEADVNKRSKSSDWIGCTALHFAAKYCSERSVKFLLRAGADVNARDEKGNTPLFFAKDINVAKVLLNAGASLERCHNLLPLAAKHRCIDLVEKALQNGADVNTTDEDGRTALHFASSVGNLNLLNLLLERGAKADLRERKDGYTALHFAAKRKDVGTEIVSALLKHGADIDAESISENQVNRAKKPSFRADPTGSAASSSVTRLSGKTALYIAAEEGVKENVLLLLKHGADVNIQYCDRTPRSCAEKKHYDLVTSSEFNSRNADEYAKDVAKRWLESHVRSNEWHPDRYRNYDEYESAVIQEEDEVYESAYDRGYEVYFERMGDDPVSHHLTEFSYISKRLAKHVVLLKCAGFFVNESDLKYYQVNYEYHTEFYGEDSGSDVQPNKTKCLEELVRMKQTQICSKSTLYDLLESSRNRLSELCKREDFSEILDSDSFIKKYPVYGCMLSYRLRLAKKRIQILEDVNQFMGKAFSLPTLCVDTITDYLNNGDLVNFVEACQPCLKAYPSKQC